MNKIAGNFFQYDSTRQLIAEHSTQLSQTPTTSYLTTDHLGSPRIQTNALGQVISRHDYQPFGEEIARSGYGADAVRKKFTGYERDAETNLDFAQARYYRKDHGRFNTSDLFGGNILNPQTFNRYIYVLNNPLNLIDPTGFSPESNKGFEDINFKKNILNPGNPIKNFQSNRSTSDDEKRQAANSTEGWDGFEIINEKGNTVYKFGETLVFLSSDMVNALSSEYEDFYDRGVTEASLFYAAINAMRGMLENFNTQAKLTGSEDSPIRKMLENLQNQIDSARLGVPIYDMNGQGLGAGGATFSADVSYQRQAVEAVTAYNAYLAETESLLYSRGLAFAEQFSSKSLTIWGKLSKGAKWTSVQASLTSGTSQDLFRRRMAIARRSGQLAIQ